MGKPNAKVTNKGTSDQSSKARGIGAPTRLITKSKSCGSTNSSFLSNKPVRTRANPKWRKHITKFRKFAAHVSSGDDEFQDANVRKVKKRNLMELEDGSEDSVKTDIIEPHEDSNFDNPIDTLFEEFTNLKL